MKVSQHPYRDGVFSGIIASLVLIAVSLVVRAGFGVGTIPELASDRIAPLLGIPLFMKSLNILGGYSHLKELGVVSVLLAVLIGGGVVGLLYGRMLKTLDAAQAKQVTACIVALILLVTLAGLWPNLGTNYHGLPPSRAIAASIATLLIVTAVFVVMLFWINGLMGNEEEPEAQGDRRRRAIGIGVLATTALAVSGGLLGCFYRMATYSYDGTENAGEDLPPVTPDDKFYQVTKNNVDPRVSLGSWTLEVGGSVGRPAVLHLDDLQGMTTVLQETTLQCISNAIGGGLNSNAIWKGVPLKDVLTTAGFASGARQVLFHGADGFTDDIPIDKALHPQTLLVFEMNGQPLPQRHGYPVRLIVPGYVGEKSVKWLTKIEVQVKPTKGFYEHQGWGPQFTINNSSRFDTPKFDHPLHLGQRTVIKGTAFAGDRGVQRVEVSTDGEKTWQQAEITYRGSDLAWVQWRFPWQPDRAGNLVLAVRCVDGRGGIQSGMSKGSGPEPAQGYHRIKASVQA